MNHAELRQYFYRKLSPIYLQGELQALYHWCVLELEGWSRAEAYLKNYESVGERQLAAWNAVIKRLLNAEPVQYIFNKAEFCGLELYVNPSVLIPRPETEELVHLLLEGEHEAMGAHSVFDLGTGSGCIALAIKNARKHWKVYACDVSAEALEVASKNAAACALDVEYLECNLLSEQVSLPEARCWVSNPPYIPRDLEHTLASNVLAHEPHLALFAPVGEAFLFYERIVELALPRGVASIYFETHATEMESLVTRLSNSWPGEITVIRDLQGKERFMVLRRELPSSEA